jgi:DNA-binding transcriptional ArsR family regulator
MEFSAEFTAFVRENVVSVEQINVLLLLSEDVERSWSVEEISQALTSSDGSIGERLGVLRRRGLIRRETEGRFRYASSPERDSLVEELRREFARRPVSVIALIFSRRDDALESFADAFRLGGEDDDDR